MILFCGCSHKIYWDAMVLYLHVEAKNIYVSFLCMCQFRRFHRWNNYEDGKCNGLYEPSCWLQILYSHNITEKVRKTGFYFECGFSSTACHSLLFIVSLKYLHLYTYFFQNCRIIYFMVGEMFEGERPSSIIACGRRWIVMMTWRYQIYHMTLHCKTSGIATKEMPNSCKYQSPK